MVKDLYNKLTTEVNYSNTALETDSDYDILVSKIKMILFTEKGEVLGEPTLGLSLKDYLFKYNMPVSNIKRNFYNQLSYYAQDELENHTVELNIRPVYTPNSIIYIIDCKIDGKLEIYTEM